MRKVNTRFFAFLSLTALLMVGTAFGLHRLQASNITNALLWQANQAEKEGKLDRAAKFLTRYLDFARQDLDQRERLGMLLSEPQLATSPQRRARARFVIEQVLAKDPQRHVLRQRLCQMAIAERSFDPAKEHLNYLEKNQPDSAEVLFLIGHWHEAQNQLGKAAELYRRAIKIDPGKAETYIRLVGVLKQIDYGNEPRHTEEINKLVTAALQKAPQDAGVLSLAAEHAQEKGDTPVALRYLENGLQKNPADPRLYLALASIHSQSGKTAEAIGRLQTGLQKIRKDQQYELRWMLANLLVDENRLDECKKLITEIGEVNSLSANYLDARLQMKRGRWFEAAKQFERIRPVLKSAKELTVQLDLSLGACYEQMEEPVLQQMAFQRAAAADSTSLLAQRGIASALWTLGQTGEALKICQELVTRTKDPDEAAKRRLEYARMLMQSNSVRQATDWKQIDDELDQAEKRLGKSVEVRLLRAELAFRQGEKEKSEKLLYETIKTYADRHEPWLALIAHAAGKEDHETAGQLMKTAENRFKDKMEFRLAQIRYLAYLRPDEAVAELKRIEPELNRFKPAELSTLLQAVAATYYDAHQYADAGRVLRQMTQLPLHDQDIRLRMQMLEVALVQDDDGRAREALDDIKRLEGEQTISVEWSFGEALRLTREGRLGKKAALDKARHLLTVAAAQRPNWHPILQLRAELDELQGKPDHAMANYRRALDLGCRDPQVMKQLIHLLSQAHRLDEVDEIIGRMQKLYGTTDDVVKVATYNAYRRNDYKKAEYLARQLVAKNSKNYRDHVWLGHVLTMGSKESNDAELAFRFAVVLAPQQPETWISLVRYLSSVGKNEAARDAIENAKKAVPADLKHLTLAQCHELLGDFALAEQNYRAGLLEQTSSAILRRAAADFFLRNGAPAPAVPLYREIVERKVPVSDEEVALAQRSLALTLVKANLPTATAEALRLVGLKQDENGNIAESTLADSVSEQLVQAKVLGSMAHHRLRLLAIAMLEGLQQKNLLQAEDQFFLARLLCQHNAEPAYWQKARVVLKTLVDNHPKSPRILAFAAHIHLQQKEFNDAEMLIGRLENVEQERKLVAGGYGTIELRAKACELRGQGEQAVTLLTSYAEQKGAFPIRKLLLADLQGRLGHFREAIDQCEEVRKLGKHDNDAIATALAVLRQNQPGETQANRRQQWLQQRDRVETILRGGLQSKPKDIFLRLHMADLLELKGQYKEVEKLCREVLQDDKTNLVALNNLAWLLGQHPDKSTEALSMVDRAIEAYGLRPELLDTRAVVRLKMGQVSESIRDLERVVNEAPTPTRLFHLSRAYDRAKNTTSALAQLRRANEMGLTVQHLHPVEQADYQQAIAGLNKQ